MNRLISFIFALPLALSCTLAANAQSSCSSDGTRQPTALLERFINADCETCWADKQTPEPASGTLAIDWVTPGLRGDDAPLSAVAALDGGWRLEALGKSVPARSSSVFSQRSAGTGGALKLRVAHGLPVNDYIGTSIEMRGGGSGPFTAWLLLVESLPAGTEGTVVDRNLVRNAFSVEWKGAAAKRYEIRPMRIAEGTKPSRLRVVGWVQDAQGKVRAIAQSHCSGK
ncbi:MAG TPA: hypothetical protein VL593_06865 [Ramlibacter sp.]|nr:hypothetical protein [Ramlibacter sp.]